jgi:hypothetical protein
MWKKRIKIVLNGKKKKKERKDTEPKTPLSKNFLIPPHEVNV